VPDEQPHGGFLDSEVSGGLGGQMRNQDLHGRADDRIEFDEPGEGENSEGACAGRA
jgi:hypothetical protein